MKAVLSNRIYLSANPTLQEYVDKELTYTIPNHDPRDPPLTIKNMGIIRKDLITVPSGREDLIPKDYEIVDKRITVPTEFPDFKFELRASQQKVFDVVDESCIINAWVSWGKTFTGLAIAGKLGQKTLIVTHTLPLRKQWENEVEKVYVVTRSSTDYIAAAAEDSDKVSVIMHKDFTDYTGLENELGDVSTVLWALGTSSLQVDEATYTLIHVDFPAAFVKAWLSARQATGNIDSPMAYHFIAGMGTDSSDAPWAHDKRKTERDVAAMAEGNGLRSFSYRSAYIRPISETTNVGHHITEALLRPGKLVTSSKELGQAMLEISARTKELANGTLLDNGDSLAYSKAYLLRLPKRSD